MERKNNDLSPYTMPPKRFDYVEENISPETGLAESYIVPADLYEFLLDSHSREVYAKIPEELATPVYEYMRLLGYTPESLAEESGVSLDIINDVLSGIARPEYQLIVRLLLVLHLEPKILPVSGFQELDYSQFPSLNSDGTPKE